MLDVLTWLLALEILGLVAFPLVFSAVPWLPDRGFFLTKPAGLLLAFYSLWLLASVTVIPNSLITLLLVLSFMAVASVVVARRQQRELREFLRREWRVLLLSEAVFLGVLAIWLVVKHWDAAISHTEQPMDFAFLNSTVVSRHFPPEDPWLSGQPVSYYYFGYLIFGGLARLASVSTAVGYNLALASVAALGAAAIFGLAMNVVRLAGGGVRPAALSGLVGVFLLMGIANLGSLFELLRASGFGSPQFWHWVNIKGLEAPLMSSTWYPSEADWWWWRATRIVDTVVDGRSLDYTISEFPFFSFLLGDLHPHVMSLPFVLAFTGLVLNFFVAPTRLGLSWVRSWSGAREIAVFAVSLGALGFINLWDLPVFGTLFAGAVMLRAYRQEGLSGRMLWNALLLVVPVALLAMVLYSPFYLSFDTQAKGVLPVEQYVSRPLHFLAIWGFFLLIAVPFVLWELVPFLRRSPRNWRAAAGALAFSLLPWLVWVAVELALGADVALWRRLLHLSPLMFLLAGTMYVVLRQTRGPVEGAPASSVPSGEEAMAPAALPARAFPMMLLALAVLLLMGPELFRLLDVFNNRMNTVFKLYYQAWALLSLVCAWALYSLGQRYVVSARWARLVGYVWIGLLALGLMAALYYPAAAGYAKTSGLKGKGTLDGLAYVANSSPGELGAIRWLKDNRRPGDRIIEAVGGDFSDHGRVSAATGIPTVLGWMGHEEQWGRSRSVLEERMQAVQRFYQTEDIREARDILVKYGVKYIVVGLREMAGYGLQSKEKFAALGQVVFPGADTVIYRVGE